MSPFYDSASSNSTRRFAISSRLFLLSATRVNLEAESEHLGILRREALLPAV